MTPQALKNSILQRAVQGRLVEQRAEEGTAEELYQKIQAEKQRLIKEGKIKKDKPLPAIAEEEIPFDIPESWKWVNLKNITYPVGNRDNQILASEVRSEGLYPAISQGNTFIDGYSNVEKKVVNDLPLVMFGDHTRNVKLIDFPFVISADGTRFMKPVCIYPKFLYFWMLLAAANLKNRGYARHFNLLVKSPVPLPPLTEQHRIVAKIEELLPLVERYEKAWSRLEEVNKRFPSNMQKAILQTAIQGKLVEQRAEEGTAEELYQKIQAEKQRLIKEGKIKKEKPLPEITENEKPFAIPESWKWVRIGQIFTLQAGKNITANNIYESQDIEHPFLCYGGNGVRGYVSWYNREGEYVLIGRQGALCGNVNYASNRFFATEHAVVVGHYNICSVLWSLYFLRALNLNQYATATAQPGLAVSNIIEVLIPLPPLAEQRRIVAKIEELLPLCEKLR